MPITIEIKQGIETKKITFYTNNKICKVNLIPIDDKNKMIPILSKQITS